MISFMIFENKSSKINPAALNFPWSKGGEFTIYLIFSRHKTKILLLHGQLSDQDTCLALPCNDEYQGSLAIQFLTCDLALSGQSLQQPVIIRNRCNNVEQVSQF